MSIIKFIFCLLFFQVLQAQQPDSLSIKYDETKFTIEEIQEEELNSYKQDREFDYSETVSEGNFLNKFFNWLQNILLKILEFIFGVEQASGILRAILKTLPYLLLGVLIFLLLKLFLKINNKQIITGEITKNTVTLSTEEELLKNADIENLINKAIDQQNFRLAIRYYYILALKNLTEQNLIDWKPQKTNSDYFFEIETPTVKSAFKEITRIYDYIWYGEFPINQDNFLNYQHTFQKLNTSIKSR